MIERVYNWVTSNAIEKAWPEGIRLFIEKSSRPPRMKDLIAYPFEPQAEIIMPEDGYPNMWACSNCDTINAGGAKRFARSCSECGKSWQEVAMFIPSSPIRREIKAAMWPVSGTYSPEPWPVAGTYAYQPLEEISDRGSYDKDDTVWSLLKS